MNLILDFGNTFQKVFVFDGDEIIFSHRYNNINIKDLEEVFSKFAIKNSILSSVINEDKNILEFLKKNSIHIYLDENTPIPIKNKYKTPETLGKDRLASAVGAASLFPAENVLAIDAGTAVKYDFVNENGEYLGGGIGPGMYLRFKVLHNDTDKLPLVDYEIFGELIGKSTKESILAGVMQGFAAEIEGMIQRYNSEFNNLKVILTGGELIYFEKLLKSNIFADPNLVVKGLNKILSYNT
jgi:type III pantothenate kinase